MEATRSGCVAGASGSSSTVARPVAKFTPAATTPPWRRRVRSTRAAHDPHVIPSTSNTRTSPLLGAPPRAPLSGAPTGRGAASTAAGSPRAGLRRSGMAAAPLLKLGLVRAGAQLGRLVGRPGGHPVVAHGLHELLDDLLGAPRHHGGGDAGLEVVAEHQAAGALELA